MYESINVLYIIDIITKVILVIIAYFIFKIAWRSAKNKQSNINVQENNPYSPYNCDEETETLLVLSIPIRIIPVGFSLWAVIDFIYYYNTHFLDRLLLGIGLVCGSLIFSWKPIKVIIVPDSITFTYSFSFFTRTKRISKKEISHIAYNKKMLFLRQRVIISIVRINQMSSNVLDLSSRNENSLINNSKIVLSRVSKILGLPIKPYRAA